MIALVIALTGIAAQATADVPELSVATAKREIVSRDGQIVRVRGWVSERCYNLGCSLLARPNLKSDSGAARLSIAYIPALEATIQRARGVQVVIEGVLDASCEREICTDRVPELKPLRIISMSGRTVDFRP